MVHPKSLRSFLVKQNAYRIHLGIHLSVNITHPYVCNILNSSLQASSLWGQRTSGEAVSYGELTQQLATHSRSRTAIQLAAFKESLLVG